MNVRVLTTGNSPVQAFAAQELRRYLGRMMPGVCAGEAEGDGGTIRLGLLEDFGEALEGLEDRRYDDGFAVDVDRLSGHIAGSNDRSVLFGVYRFLEEAGCHWARHGADGEYVPERDLSGLRVRLRDKAAYRHRGLCIEGADSLEIMLGNIDWAMKAGFNSYFLQFFVPYTFFERFHSHAGSTRKAPEPLAAETVGEWKRRMEEEIGKRGLLYHAVGHGWTCESIGIEGREWKPGKADVGDGQRELLAQVDGRRELWHGVALNTNLCYSNPRARSAVVRKVADYLSGSARVDFLHLWLADDGNNHCECEGCRSMRPSDFYVLLLNEIDAELTRLGLGTRIVFLAYMDLLWAPEREKFTNPDRFLFLFAPITRSYDATYDTHTEGIALPSYERNRLRFPGTVAENIAHTDRWREMYRGDGCAFEYYFMWDHFLDPGYYAMTDVMGQDIRSLRGIGLNGLISCQCQRSFFPTGFPMYVMGRMLWDGSATPEGLAAVYFSRTFGPDGERCRQYMRELSRLFDPPYLRGLYHGGRAWGAADAETRGRLETIPSVVADFMPVVRQNAEKACGCARASWKYLEYHGEVVSELARALLEMETGRADRARERWAALADRLSLLEDELVSVLDLFEYVSVVGRLFS